MATMLGAGILYGYLFKPAFGELADNISNRSRDSPIGLNAALIKPLHCP